MQNILIVGGAGYIGTELSSYLLEKNYKITCLDSLIYAHDYSTNELKKNKNFRFIEGDIRDETTTLNSLENINSVVILAGLVGDPITKKYPKIGEEINLVGIRNFINNCIDKKINKLIFVSTCSNYGITNNQELADENYRLKPLSDYAKHKVEIEKYIMSLKNKVDFSPTILRFATAFGLSKRMRFDLTINQFTKELFLKSDQFKVYDQNTWRPYCHIKDFSRLIEIVISGDKKKTDFQIFNAGSDQNNHTKKDILKKISEVFPVPNIKLEKEDVDKRNYRVNFSKVKKILDFDTQYDITYGIKEIYDYLNLVKKMKKNIQYENLGNFKIVNEK